MLAEELAAERTHATCSRLLRDAYLRIRDGAAVVIEREFGRYSDECQKAIKIQHEIIELMHKVDSSK